jgi:hypothetical protein
MHASSVNASNGSMRLDVFNEEVIVPGFLVEESMEDPDVVSSAQRWGNDTFRKESAIQRYLTKRLTTWGEIPWTGAYGKKKCNEYARTLKIAVAASTPYDKGDRQPGKEARPEAFKTDWELNSTEELHGKTYHLWECQHRDGYAAFALTHQPTDGRNFVKPFGDGHYVGPAGLLETTGIVAVSSADVTREANSTEGRTTIPPAPEKTTAETLRGYFLGRSDKFWGIGADNRIGGGIDRMNCGLAPKMCQKLGAGRVQFVSLHAHGCPESSIAQKHRSHYFAIVDERFIVDPWLADVEPSKEKGLYDLSAEDDAPDIQRLYGNQSDWRVARPIDDRRIPMATEKYRPAWTPKHKDVAHAEEARKQAASPLLKAPAIS